jgi:hypothetical protein
MRKSKLNWQQITERPIVDGAPRPNDDCGFAIQAVSAVRVEIEV